MANLLAAPLPDLIVNAVENLACRLAERHGGRITATHLMPYLPLPLDTLRAALDGMVDDHSIYPTTTESLRFYEFSAYHEAPPRPGILRGGSCVGCRRKFPPNRQRVWCPACREDLRKCLQRRLKETDWLPQARLEHELVHLAAQNPGPLPAATLASRSQATLQAVNQALERLSLAEAVHQEVDLHSGRITYDFPDLAYPAKHYRENVDLFTRLERPAGAKVWLWSGVGALLLGGLLYAVWPAGSPQTPGPVRSPRDVAARRPVPAPVSVPEEPPAAETAGPPGGRSVIPVRISIRKHGFTPVGMRLAASWNRSTPLSPRRPAGVHREPRYHGTRQLYGVLSLGTLPDNRFPFVFDLMAEARPVLYFDLNHNGDLTDDGGPWANRGSGTFATSLSIPFASLLQNAPFPGDFHLWFFTNTSLWPDAVAHYSLTQLQGSVRLGGRSYVAYLADTRDNDADFTNDGMALDLDGNGKIDGRRERFGPHDVAVIGDKAYRFTIGW